MKIAITAGGTGGHIFPALAIINNILHKDSAHKSAIDMMFDAIGK